MKKILAMTIIAAGCAAAQEVDTAQIQEAIDQAKAAMKSVDLKDLKFQIDKASKSMKLLDMDELRMQIDAIPKIDMFEIDTAIAQAKDSLKGIKGGMIAGIPGGVLGGISGFAFAPQSPQVERAREQAERDQEARDRAREARDRVRETEDRNVELYRDGTNAVDEKRYERAIERFDRVIGAKWTRADGAYYWKAYALNKLGKRDEALAALAEIPKQFPQSRWINDAKALQTEIQQAAGRPVSPEAQSDEDLKLMALQALMNSGDADRALPAVEKLLNDPKTALSVKSRALFVLAQSRSDKARDVVAQYAKSGSNPDLQIRAVSYLGTYRGKDSQQTLADIYAANTDLSVRRAVLRGMMISRDSQHLFNAAKTEQNADLRREAIRGLGQMRASNELAQLYSSETNAELKETIVEAIWMSRNTDKLIEIAKSEKDPKIRGYAIQRLGMMRDNEAVPPALAAMYASETDKTIKLQIMRSLWMSGSCKQLVDALRTEKDQELKAQGVSSLSHLKNCKEATDYLMELIAK